MDKSRKNALYIHIPFCIRKCSYCDFASYEDYSLQEAYFKALKKEISIVSQEWKNCAFDTLFFGGGTPTSVKNIYLESVIEKAHKKLNITLHEATVEANPGTVNLDKLKFYLYMGINRISFGMQAAQDGVLKSVGRIHTSGQTKESVETAHHAGFTNISVDLMSGLPGQKAGDLLESVESASGMGVNHISMYALKVEESTPLFEAVKSGKIKVPNKDEEYAMSKAARERLAELGFARYEISNYAKKGYECHHNLHYWKNDDFLGVGLAAASAKGGLRTINTRDIYEYIEKIEKGELPYAEKTQSSDEEYAFETLMLGLRLTCGVDIVEYQARHGINLEGRLSKEIASLKERKLADIYESRLYLTEAGMDIQNTVLVELMEKFDF